MIRVRVVEVTTTPAPVNTGAGPVTVHKYWIQGESTAYPFVGGPDVNTTDKGVQPGDGLAFPVARSDDLVYARTETGVGHLLVIETGIG